HMARAVFAECRRVVRGVRADTHEPLPAPGPISGPSGHFGAHPDIAAAILVEPENVIAGQAIAPGVHPQGRRPRELRRALQPRITAQPGLGRQPPFSGTVLENDLTGPPSVIVDAL